MRNSEECIDRGNKSCKEIINMFENEKTKEKLIKLHKFGLDKVPYEEAIKKVKI